MVNFYFKNDPNKHIVELQLIHERMMHGPRPLPWILPWFSGFGSNSSTGSASRLHQLPFILHRFCHCGAILHGMLYTSGGLADIIANFCFKNKPNKHIVELQLIYI
jgi:hypothetical protein